MPNPLPPEIQCEPLFPNGQRYVLPRRGLGCISIIPVLMGLAILAFMTFWSWGFVGGIMQAFGPAGMLAGLFAAPGFLAALAAIAIGFAMRFGHSEYQITEDQLIAIERIGLLRRRRRGPIAKLSKFALSTAASAGNDDTPTPLPINGRGAIRIEWTRGKPWWTAIGYPRELLKPLSDELARQCNTAISEPGITSSEDAPEIEATEDEPVHFDPKNRHAVSVDLLERPENSRVQYEPLDDGLTLRVPPAGVWKGSAGLMVFAILWNGFMVVFTSLVVASMFGGAGKGPEGFWERIGFGCFLALFWAVGIGILFSALHMGRREAAIAVTGGSLMVLQTGLFRSKSREWQPGEIAAIRSGPSGMEVNDVPVMELQIMPKDGKKFGLMGGYNEQELAWVATLLRQALDVPALLK